MRPSITAAAIAAVLALTAAGASVHAGDSPQPAAGDVAIPDGYRRVVDDTGTISVAIPDWWTYVDTSLYLDGNGGLHPSIKASPAILQEPACDGCGPGLELPQLHYWATPYEEEDAIEGCDEPESAPIDNGRFVGHLHQGVGCDAAIDEIHAHDVSRSMTAHLSFIYWSAGATPEGVEPVGGREAALETWAVIQDTFDWTGVPVVSLPPSNVAPSDSLYFYPGFGSVPRLGEEPVRGSGCGSQGQIGDVIPDGLWAGYVDALELDAAGAGTIGIDLLCIYFGESARAVATEGTANILNNDPDYLIVNNNERVRTLPTSPSLVLRESVADGDGACLEASPESPVQPEPKPDTQAWIRVDGGAVAWVLWGCGPFGEPGG
jgi:hypothetical protein